MQFRLPVATATALLTLVISVPTIGATIDFSPATTVSSDNDVDASGALVGAYIMNNPVNATEINDVTFTQFSTRGNTSTDGNVTISFPNGGDYGGFGTGAPGTPWANLSQEYQALLTNGYYAGTSTATVVLNNLNNGDTYQVEIWVNDSRNEAGTGYGRTETVSGDPGGTDATLTYDVGEPENTDGGVGQFTIGTFEASGNSQTINFAASALAEINGLEIRDVSSVPEPSVLSVLTAGGFVLLAKRRARRPTGRS
jgi:hypothetical protein